MRWILEHMVEGLIVIEVALLIGVSVWVYRDYKRYNRNTNN